MEGDSSKFYATFAFAPRINISDGLRSLILEPAPNESNS
jgi:hypothetical protein